jgi:hypothetical protein
VDYVERDERVNRLLAGVGEEAAEEDEDESSCPELGRYGGSGK